MPKGNKEARVNNIALGERKLWKQERLHRGSGSSGTCDVFYLFVPVSYCLIK